MDFKVSEPVASIRRMDGTMNEQTTSPNKLPQALLLVGIVVLAAIFVVLVWLKPPPDDGTEPTPNGDQTTTNGFDLG